MCSKYAFNKVRVPTLSFVLAMAIASAVLVSSTSSTVWGQQLAVEAKAKQEQAKTGSQRPAKGSDFIRVRRNADQKATAMETSIVRYEMTNADGEKVVVDLIGVVHIGEKDYYDQLNELFKSYDALLYELVAPEGTRIPKGGRAAGGITNPVAALQQGMQSMLGLEFQLEHIDYMANNFVHADMTPAEFAESMEKNDESVFKIILRAIGQGMAMQGAGGGAGTSDMEILMAIMSGNQEQKLRSLMAEQMVNADMAMVIFEGKDGSTIINHRNAKCVEILKKQIEEGNKHLAIFYGAGHMTDFDKRLREDLGMKRGGRRWLQAWNLK
jgi:hypothetical protein